MRRLTLLTSGLALCLAVIVGLGLVASISAADTRTPEQVVSETADTLATRIDGHQKELEANPAELYTLVGDIFLPVFDTEYAGRLVLGKYWRTATPAQRQEFVDAFYTFMLAQLCSLRPAVPEGQGHHSSRASRRTGSAADNCED
ncbi:MAG: ABC transporter substrate-binding protein [Gammaproteobacteria bacterium]